MQQQCTSNSSSPAKSLLRLLVAFFSFGMTRSFSWHHVPRIWARSVHQLQKSAILGVTAPSYRTVGHAGAQTALFSSLDSDSFQPDDKAQPSQSQKEHVVKWETANGIVGFPAYDGEILRTAALRRGLVSPHNGRAQLINCKCICKISEKAMS